MGYESHRPPGSWEDLGVSGTLQFNEMPPTVFISYSHKDEDWKDRLLEHLGALKPQGGIEVWDDRKIRGGDEWPAEIWKAMDAAHKARDGKALADFRGNALQTELKKVAFKKKVTGARAADLMQIRVDFEREIGHPDAEEHAADVQSLRARIAGQSS
jgi:hypothetical protein